MQFVSVFISGLFLGGSLIVAIGAQNAFILRQGLSQSHVFILCLICALSDSLLIAAGVAGLGIFISQSPEMIKYVALAGAIFLGFYGLLALKRMLKPEAMQVGHKNVGSLKVAISTCVAMTFLNPHVYLDTVVLIGGLSASYDGYLRFVFGGGAIAASFVWFFSLGYGARFLVPFFEKPMSWRILDGMIAFVMLVLAYKLFVQFLNA